MCITKSYFRLPTKAAVSWEVRCSRAACSFGASFLSFSLVKLVNETEFVKYSSSLCTYIQIKLHLNQQVRCFSEEQHCCKSIQIECPWRCPVSLDYLWNPRSQRMLLHFVRQVGCFGKDVAALLGGPTFWIVPIVEWPYPNCIRNSKCLVWPTSNRTQRRTF